MRRFTFGALALPLAVWSMATTCGADALKPQGAGPREKGAIVDGLVNGQAINDRAHTEIQGGSLFSALFPLLPVGDIEASGASDEAIVFAGRRPPALVPAAWTSGNDTISFAFEDEYRIAVQVWIVHGPYADVAPVALDAAVETAEIWSSERQGIAFEAFDVVDATADPDAPDVLDFNCTMLDDIKTRIGFTADRLNVYYVTTVNFGSGGQTTNGVWCGSGVIGMGHSTSGHLLAHEIGHAFTLQHVTGTPELNAWFDAKNVMAQFSNDRRYLTEGQIFRAVFTPTSALNGSIYDVRPGQALRACGQTDTNSGLAQCPPVQKRIWPDGTWPPN